MTLNDATQAYTDSERTRIMKEAARFNGHIDHTVEKLEKKIEDIYDLQSKLYELTDTNGSLDESAINRVLSDLHQAGVRPTMDVANGNYRPY